MKNISIPFQFSGGRVGATTDVDSIARQKIIDVLTTIPHERFGTPNYGAGIKGLLFEPIDELVEADFKTDAITEVHRRVSGVTIHDIRVQQNFVDESTADVFVYYSLPLSPVQTLTFTITATLTEESPL
jgi:phage baseplate assembly protein W